jgi:hypothetical protein
MWAAVSYWHPATDSAVEIGIDSRKSLLDAVTRAVQLEGGRGRPAVQLERADGSSLSLATDGQDAYLVWIDSLGASFHSCGGAANRGVLVFDYFGSWSEASPEWLAPYGAAMECLVAFWEAGVPSHPDIMFEPD